MCRKILWSAVLMVFSGVLAFGQQSNVQFTPYGYIKFDSTYDTARTAFGDLAFWVLPEGADAAGERELNFSARETRFGLNIAAPENRGVRTTGRIELDFYEEVTPANKYVPRLRLAYIDLAWNNGWSLRFGQEWDTYVSFHPDMIDASALAYQGHPYSRHPQARVTKDVKLGENTALTAKFAVQYGRNTSNVDGDGQPDENAASTPNFHGSFVLKPRLLTDRQSIFAISGVYGREKLNGTENPGTYKTWMIHGGIQLPLSQRFTVQGIAWKGENLDNYLLGIGQGINAIDGTEVSTRGGWGQLVYTLTKNTRTGIGYGIEDPSDEDLSGDARTRNDRIFTNFFYNATDRVTFGVEYSSLRTDYAVSKDMQTHRVNFAVIYRF
jgi:hypothetical protein